MDLLIYLHYVALNTWFVVCIFLFVFFFFSYQGFKCCHRELHGGTIWWHHKLLDIRVKDFQIYTHKCLHMCFKTSLSLQSSTFGSTINADAVKLLCTDKRNQPLWKWLNKWWHRRLHPPMSELILTYLFVEVLWFCPVWQFPKKLRHYHSKSKKKQPKFSSDRTGAIFALGVWRVLQKNPLPFSAGNLDQNTGWTHGSS